MGIYLGGVKNPPLLQMIWIPLEVHLEGTIRQAEPNCQELGLFGMRPLPRSRWECATELLWEEWKCWDWKQGEQMLQICLSTVKLSHLRLLNVFVWVCTAWYLRENRIIFKFKNIPWVRPLIRSVVQKKYYSCVTKSKPWGGNQREQSVRKNVWVPKCCGRPHKKHGNISACAKHTFFDSHFSPSVSLCMLRQMPLYGFILRDFLPFSGLKVQARLRGCMDFGSRRPHGGHPSELRSRSLLWVLPGLF